MGPFPSGLALAITAALTVWLREVGLTHFRGNVLGFIGLCSLILLGCAACCYGRYRYIQTRRRHEAPYR